MTVRRVICAVAVALLLVFGTVTAYADVTYLSAYASTGYGAGMCSGIHWGSNYYQYGGFWDIGPGALHVIGCGVANSYQTWQGTPSIVYSYQIEYDMAVSSNKPMLRMSMDGALITYATEVQMTYYDNNGNELFTATGFTGRDMLEMGFYDVANTFGVLYYPDTSNNSIAAYNYSGGKGDYGVVTIPNLAASSAYAVTVRFVFPEEEPPFTGDMEDLQDILGMPFNSNTTNVLVYLSTLSNTELVAPLVYACIFLLAAAMLVKFML